MQTPFKTALAAAFLLSTTALYAATTFDKSSLKTAQKNHFGIDYIGAGLGHSMVDFQITNINNVTLDEKDSASKVFVGIKITPNLAVEAHYAHLGGFVLSGESGGSFDYEGDTYNVSADTVETLEFVSYGLATVYSLPTKDGMTPFVKLGVHHWESDTIVDTDNANNTTINTDLDAFYGVGLRKQLNKNTAIQVDVEQFEFDEINTANAVISVVHTY